MHQIEFPFYYLKNKMYTKSVDVHDVKEVFTWQKCAIKTINLFFNSLLSDYSSNIMESVCE